MIFLSVALSLIFVSASIAPSQTRDYGLPAGARLIESQVIASSARPRRALLLWMSKPSQHPLPYGAEEYTCPDETRGSFYRGPTRVSLVDTGTNRLINTIKIQDESGQDSFDLPYKIRVGAHYHVPKTLAGSEGKPSIMFLKDYNGDGRALEFALFDAQACMGLQTTLVGYSIAQDMVIQFPVKLETDEGGQRTSNTTRWIDYLFSKRPTKPGHWKYRIDYRGRGGQLEEYEIHYDPRAEMFVGKFHRHD
ncbi:MAG TPA: hypothetical protein VF666_10610 [Pyrinomonadaceae bacterium]|jgi:hypothetical protein